MDDKHKEELYNKIDGMQKRSIKWYWELLKSDAVIVQFELAVFLSIVYWFKIDWERLWQVFTLYYLMLVSRIISKWWKRESEGLKTGSSGQA